MANRHLSRSLAMQSLYEWDFKGKDPKALEGVIERNVKEFGPLVVAMDSYGRSIYKELKK